MSTSRRSRRRTTGARTRPRPGRHLRRPAARRALPVLLVAVLATVLAACSGVPRTSSPQVVRSIGLGETPTAQVPSPPRDADPRTIVTDFLKAMLGDPDRHDAARAYLTAADAQKWSDSTVTVVSNYRVLLFDPTTRTVVVSYQQVGSVSASGVYTPTLAGTGVADEAQATFTLVQDARRQWRISAPVPPGLFVLASDFAALYTPRPLYFLDSRGTRLVPDLRWSALNDPSLESFLLAQLVAGPRPELASAVTTEVPDQSGQARAGVTPGSPTVVQLPGAAALSGASRTRLAAQVAATFRQTLFGSSLQIRDGGQDVAVPDVSGPFDYTDFPSYASVPSTDNQATPTATFVRDGAVQDASGKPLPGQLGSGRYALTSASFDRSGGGALVVGTSGAGASATLLLGAGDTLTPVAGVPAPTTRPVWAPNTPVPEAWVASGATIVRVSPGKAPTPVNLTGRSGPVTGTITGLAFSPEGARLALVVHGTDGTAQVWLAGVIRNGPDVRLDQVEPVTPVGIAMDDVGWYQDDTHLIAVGQDGTRLGGFWTLRTDGSALTYEPADGLPDRPRSLAVTPMTSAWWVTVGTDGDSTVWVRSTASLGAWVAPDGGPSEPGSAPSYAG